MLNMTDIDMDHPVFLISIRLANRIGPWPVPMREAR